MILSSRSAMLASCAANLSLMCESKALAAFCSIPRQPISDWSHVEWRMNEEENARGRMGCGVEDPGGAAALEGEEGAREQQTGDSGSHLQDSAWRILLTQFNLCSSRLRLKLPTKWTSLANAPWDWMRDFARR